MAQKRLLKELDLLRAIYDVELVNDSLFKWHIALCGPDTSPYYGGTFLVEISFPTNYPFESPTLTFVTQIYHPNINKKGDTCLPVLGNGWTASNTIVVVLETLKDILMKPNPNDPMDATIANQYKMDPSAFEKYARIMAEKYAM